MPIHRNLVDCGLLHFVEKQRRSGQMKLFEEIDPGTKGVRAVAFSKWFTQFPRSCGAYQSRTCFHAFRHNFRDELRDARVDHDLAMALARGEYWDERVEMMQRWSDYLGQLRDGGKILRPEFGAKRAKA